MRNPGFSITDNKGFQITFDNGITVSVQFGSGNYCSNRDYGVYAPGAKVPACDNAEIALFDKTGKWLTKKAAKSVAKEKLSDDVVGWVKPEQIAKYIAWACRQKT